MPFHILGGLMSKKGHIEIVFVFEGLNYISVQSNIVFRQFNCKNVMDHDGGGTLISL